MVSNAGIENITLKKNVNKLLFVIKRQNFIAKQYELTYLVLKKSHTMKINITFILADTIEKKAILYNLNLRPSGNDVLGRVPHIPYLRNVSLNRL